jgi:hypothetical protein
VGGCQCTFFAFSESSLASMVMYFSPLTCRPCSMTFFTGLLSAKESAIAWRSASEIWGLMSAHHALAVLRHLMCPSSSWRRMARGKVSWRFGNERTVKPGVAAQIVLPETSLITALSMLPVPTRL